MVRPADRQPSYVLHRRAYRETSAIVELLTFDFGRVSGIVRGVKGGRRAHHHIEPFAQVVATWRGRGELVNVLRCEAVAPRPLAGEEQIPRAPRLSALSGDALFAGLYLNELLMKTLSHEEPVAALFESYGDALESLAAGGELEPTLRTFERRLLDELGYGLAFDVDVRNGAPIDADKAYGFVIGEGFHELRSDQRAAPQRRPPFVLTGRQIAAMDAGDYRDRAVRQAAKRVFRRALELRLDGRRLTTRSLFAARPRLA